MASGRITRLNIAFFQYLLKNNVSRNGIFRRSKLCTSAINFQKEEFRMPERIQRSSTDILKALDSTIQRDKSAPDYHFHDDPYLTPISNTEKRIFALSRESGRKAATWIKDTNPDLFSHTRDDPVIKAFLPAEEFTDESTVTEHTLLELIQSASVGDAITVYKLCDKKGIEVSTEVQQSLLELLCFYNEEERPSEEWLEEKSFSRFEPPGKDITNMWRSDSVADELFLQLQPSPAAYNAIIRGHARHNHVDEAWRLYNEALKANVPLGTATYNAVLATSYIKNSNFEQVWNIVLDVLHSMSSRGVQPDLGTLNNSLQVLSSMASFKKGRRYSLQLVQELKLQGVKPSLASHYFLLLIHCKERGVRDNLLFRILDELEKEEDDIPLRDHRDVFFFTEAMEVCNKRLQSIDAANRLHSLLETGNNERFIADQFKNTIYYRNYLLLSLYSLPLPEFMELYDQLVPHVYSVENYAMEEILKSTGIQGCFNYLPTLWTDLSSIYLHKNDKVVTALLTAMCHYQPPQQPEADLLLSHQLRMIIQHLVQQVKERFEDDELTKSSQYLQWTSMMGGQVMQILGLVGGAEVGGEMLELLMAHPSFMLGDILPTDVQLLLDTAIKEQNPDVAFLCAVYCFDQSKEAGQEMGLQVAAMPELEAKHRAKLAITFGITDTATSPK